MFLLYTVSRVIEPRMASVGRVEMRLQYNTKYLLRES